MLNYRPMTHEDVELISHIDRSEYIEKIYRMEDGSVKEIPAGHECGTWDQHHLEELKTRYKEQLSDGGYAYGAFDGDRLAGFGVLANKFRGKNQDQLQVDLMYVSRNYRRQGIGRTLMDELKRQALRRGASYLYVSSTETQSAVNFYTHCGSKVTQEVDPELFELEPEDIHMLIKL
ncbi:GNAT family N-acetyltransferase [Paenibacillus sp. J22TS3]|uniref:GNAT family N-acetyltransferase n=1 Tax=Paenibacillus sp. J22TS3 TaxID=2807192 RepID=UPI001B02CD29|nr:GNAT family N-acetyltransferase [Paenibacillus sp. J22TS3]GIP21642.1 GNAT family N-acetyltransferase [Paenibacillus sp. J22TS3]